MRDELCSFVRERTLILPGDRVTCAVSGGADSMALLWALFTLRERMGLRLQCAHYNHGLRAEADEDEAFVRAFCAQHGIPFQSERGDVAAQAHPGESIELAARRLRYDFLYRASRGGLLATAHTADDNLETLLLRLTRGTSVRGLGGIPVRQGSLIRPLLFATRAQVVAFLAQEGIAYREDQTNLTDFCPRNRIRHHVVPQLKAENPKLATACLQLSTLMREEDAYLSALAAQALQACTQAGGYDCTALKALPKVLRRRALFSILQSAGVAVPTQRHLEQLTAVLYASSPSASAHFPGNVTVARRYNTLCIVSEAVPIPEMPLVFPGTTYIPQAGIKIICSAPKIFEKIENSPTKFLLSCDMIGIVLFVRARQSGDRICLPAGSRSLKRIMIDRKIPASLRAQVPVLADEAGVIAVGGIGADVRRLAKPGEPAIEIQIEKEDVENEE